MFRFVLGPAAEMLAAVSWARPVWKRWEAVEGIRGARSRVGGLGGWFLLRVPGRSWDVLARTGLAESRANMAQDDCGLAPSRGRWLGLCPLHSDHKPSFLVDPGKSLFYCYGCGRGGDVIRFVELYRQVRFPQALALLHQWRGLAPLLHQDARSGL